MTEKDRELKQVNVKLYKDQLDALDRVWKRRLLNNRSELIRIELDRIIAAEDEI